MTREDNERRLIRMVEQQRDEECETLVGRAQAEAGDLLRKTYRRVRHRLHAEIESERERTRAKTATARAELETERRRHQRLLNAIILEAAWERLPDKLAQQWGEPGSRASWIAATLAHAVEKLPKGIWRIRHPPDLDTEECAGALRLVRGRLPRAPELAADAALNAGLIIDCEGVVLDSSTVGLLQDRDLVEARLLAFIELDGQP